MRKPFFYNIDIVGRCNLACPSCPQGNSHVKLEKHFMAPEFLNALLVKAKGEAVVFGVGLFNWGEPFTHPDLPAMVRAVNKNHLLCYLSTNLNSDKNLSEVLAEEPHSIRISCSGFTQEIYKKTHANGDVCKLRSNMFELSRRRTPKTKVHMLWHRYKHNWHEEHLMREYCEWLGFGFETVQAYYMPLETVLDVWNGKQPAPAINENLLTSLSEHKILCENRTMPCRNQQQEITIDAAGKVQLCCGVYDTNKFTLCDYLSTTLEEIQATRFRHSFCDGCIRSGGHVYVNGYSHSDPSRVRSLATKAYSRVAPLVPVMMLKHFL